MYFVDRKQIEKRLAYMETTLVDAARLLEEDAQGLHKLVRRMAAERVVHLAIESVTDIGSLMIDGFIMRDASSYEDIIEILRDEGVFDEETGQSLVELVKLRRPFVQQYYELDEEYLGVWLPLLPQLLQKFKSSVVAFIERELGNLG